MLWCDFTLVKAGAEDHDALTCVPLQRNGVVQAGAKHALFDEEFFDHLKLGLEVDI